MQAPTAGDLLRSPIVQNALDQAWADSLPADPQRRHEEGGWVYLEVATGQIEVRRAPAGEMATLNLTKPPGVSGSMVVATFHTHPHPKAEEWETSPSTSDRISAFNLGVPCIIRAEDGVHTTGPASRRGGMAGDPGFPA